MNKLGNKYNSSYLKNVSLFKILIFFVFLALINTFYFIFILLFSIKEKETLLPTFYTPYTAVSNSYKNNKTSNDSEKKSIILVWTHLFGSQQGPGKQVFRDCPMECEVIFDRTRFAESDAIVFHSQDIILSDVPPLLKNHIWIYLNLESPAHTSYSYSEMKFHLTWTYRQDSDIFGPYGRLTTRDQIKDPFNYTYEDLKKDLKNKKLAAWRVSNCETNGKREFYAMELAEFIPINIYGKCGKYKCPADIAKKENVNCLTFISSNYKFYLAFENSLCHDYVTEKFFDALSTNIVPVVYGRANYSHFAPKRSYINSQNFNSPKELSEYLLYLNSHDDEYLKYFEWKKDWVTYSYNESGNIWCILCEKIVKMKDDVKKKIVFLEKMYRNLSDWWEHQPNSLNKACLNI